MNTELLNQYANELNIPLRTLDDVRSSLTKAKKKKADMSMARLMLNHGRLTDEARQFVAEYVR